VENRRLSGSLIPKYRFLFAKKPEKAHRYCEVHHDEIKRKKKYAWNLFGISQQVSQNHQEIKHKLKDEKPIKKEVSRIDFRITYNKKIRDEQ